MPGVARCELNPGGHPGRGSVGLRLGRVKDGGMVTARAAGGEAEQVLLISMETKEKEETAS